MNMIGKGICHKEKDRFSYIKIKHSYSSEDTIKEVISCKLKKLAGHLYSPHSKGTATKTQTDFPGINEKVQKKTGQKDKHKTSHKRTPVNGSKHTR